jgi:stress-induced morphogen
MYPPIMVSTEEVRRRIQSGVAGSRVEVVDTNGAGDHFDVTVASPAFAGLVLVEQHRLVYEALGDLMQTIHALSLRTTAV